MTATILDMLETRATATQSREAPEAGASAANELRRARIRIAQLERNLTIAMRDSLSHFNRAREAERRLAELTSAR